MKKNDGYDIAGKIGGGIVEPCISGKDSEYFSDTKGRIFVGRFSHTSLRSITGKVALMVRSPIVQTMATIRPPLAEIDSSLYFREVDRATISF